MKPTKRPHRTSLEVNNAVANRLTNPLLEWYTSKGLTVYHSRVEALLSLFLLQHASEDDGYRLTKSFEQAWTTSVFEAFQPTPTKDCPGDINLLHIFERVGRIRTETLQILQEDWLTTAVAQMPVGTLVKWRPPSLKDYAYGVVTAVMADGTILLSCSSVVLYEDLEAITLNELVEETHKLNYVARMRLFLHYDLLHDSDVNLKPRDLTQCACRRLLNTSSYEVGLEPAQKLRFLAQISMKEHK